MAPSASAAILKRTPIIPLPDICQSTSATKDARPHSQSNVVGLKDPRRNPYKNTIKGQNPTVAVNITAVPPPERNCAASAIKGASDHKNHVTKLG